MLQEGYIYKISNDVNDLVYIGQTSRDIYTRFEEHCCDYRSKSRIHKAIAEIGRKHFKIEIIEKVSLDEIDEREKYWISYYDACNKGYNVLPGGNIVAGRYYSQIKIVENNMIIDSKEELARILSKITSWSLRTLTQRLADVINTDKTFCDYHFISVKADIEDLTDILEVENWAKTLNVRFSGKKVHCVELNLDFDTVGETAKYLLENNYYLGTSKMPIQTLVTSLGKHLNGSSAQVDCVGGLHFYYLPGRTKNKGNSKPFQKTPVFCNELNKTFDSVAEAGKYMIDSGIWSVSIKTAKLRISDIINGIFPNYKGYTFTRVEQKGENA